MSFEVMDRQKASLFERLQTSVKLVTFNSDRPVGSRSLLTVTDQWNAGLLEQ